MHVARRVSENEQLIPMPDATAKCHINQNASRAYARMHSVMSGTLVYVKIKAHFPPMSLVAISLQAC